MLFSSLTFLFVFFPVTFLLHRLLPSIRMKNLLLILVSLIFYAYGEPVYVLLMLFSAFLNYLFGMLLGKSKTKKGVVLAAAVVLNLGILGIFKYAAMAVETLNAVSGSHFPVPHISLPVGISFFTFQAMSYVIDVYRKDAVPTKSFATVLLYISFFPQLIAGPIVKYHDIEAAIQKRSLTKEQTADGLRRFIRGISKKVLISNAMAVCADAVYGAPALNAALAWLGAIAYMLQIYYDFSGYSDMALGLGKMFGFTFRENFDAPYTADSIKNFWRRWHISLSSWFKEYLYIPLGGNRKGKVRTCINKLIVFFCTGLWHGANWTFVVWGMFHGLLSLLEEAFAKYRTKNPGFIKKLLRHLYVLLAVCIGFVIFRAESLEKAGEMLTAMFTGFSFSALSKSLLFEQLNPYFLFWLAAAVIGCLPIGNYFSKGQKEMAEKLEFIISPLLLLLCMLNLSGGAYNPFIYFQF